MNESYVDKGTFKASHKQQVFLESLLFITSVLEIVEEERKHKRLPVKY